MSHLKDPNRKTFGELCQEEAKEFLVEKKIGVGTEVVKVERGSLSTNKKSVLIRTNMYNITVNEKKFVYKYNVKITGHLRSLRTLRDLEPIEFTKASASELIGVDRMDVCSKAFDALFKLEPAVFASRHKFYYNLCAVLYSVDKLEEGYFGEFYVEDLFADEEDAAFLVKLRGREKFKIEITLEKDTNNIDLAQRFAGLKVDQDDMEDVRFFEVATWQDAIQSPETHIIFPKGRSYLSNPTDRGYHENDVDSSKYGNGIYLGVGLSKSSKLIEDGLGKEGIAIVVEPKVTLFHCAEKLTEKFRQMIETNRVNPVQIKETVGGLYFVSSHWIENLGKIRMFRIHDVGEPADVQEFVFVDKDTGASEVMTVAKYFDQQGFPLMRPDLPLIVVRQKKRKTEDEEEKEDKKKTDEEKYDLFFYPMEHVLLMDNQRVSPMNPELTGKFIRNSAVTPRILQHRIDISRNVLFLENSEFMANVGIVVSEQPIKVEASILTAPQMKYRGNYFANFDGVRSEWKGDRTTVAVSSVVKRWCAFVAVDRHARPQFTRETFENFLEIFQRECNRRGVNLGQAITEGEIVVLDPTDLYTGLHNAMKFAGENDYDFALVITHFSDKKVHSDLKAYEQKYGVVTQNVTHKVALATLGIGVRSPSNLSLGNIVNKTNMKLKGLNYEPVSGNKVLGETDLFLGITLNHLAAGMGNLRETTVPSILGYSANDMTNPIGFTGDFIYNKPSHQGFLPSVFEAACTVFQRFLTNRKTEPQRVIVYRGGCSDGEFDYVKEYEVPVLREAIREVFKKNPKLILISVNKIHNARFTYDTVPMPQGNAKEQNIQSGAVIDSKVVRPILEFYLASHRAIQGTARIPRYNILSNEAGATLSELEKVTYDLCFCHEIINSPVSVPSPLYCAEENAKRGRNLYNAEVNHGFIFQVKQELGLEGEIDHDDKKVRRSKEELAAILTHNLSYANLEIRGQRFNA